VEQRRFTVLDAMVLVATTAVGLAALRAYQANQFAMFGPLGGPPGERVAGVVTILEAWSVGLLVMAVRPGPRRWRYRRLARQPGVAALHAAALCLVLVVVLDQAEAIIHPRPGPILNTSYRLVRTAGFWTGPAIGSAWLTLATCGLWRRETHWIGRAGRVLGLAWVAFFLADMLGLV
jgi:hypothetical protein